MKKLIIVAATLITLLAPATAQAGQPVPPRPDYCKTGRCVLGCVYPHPLAPFGAVSFNRAFCARIGAPLVWFVK